MSDGGKDAVGRCVQSTGMLPKCDRTGQVIQDDKKYFSGVLK